MLDYTLNTYWWGSKETPMRTNDIVKKVSRRMCHFGGALIMYVGLDIRSIRLSVGSWELNWMSDGYLGKQKVHRICETQGDLESETTWLLVFFKWLKKKHKVYIFSNVFKDFKFIVVWFGVIKEKWDVNH